MTQNYTVINNPMLSETGAAFGLTPAQPRRFERGDALGIITGRQFHIFGDLVLHALDYVDPSAGGAFVTGKYAAKRAARLRSAHPTVPLMIEPAAIREHVATVEQPFRIDVDPNELFEPSLEAALDIQLMNGTDLAITPTGQIRVGDSETLKAVLKIANDIDRKDLLLALPLEAAWLGNESFVSQLIQILNRSRHPVLLMFVHKSNPAASRRRLEAYRRIFEETSGVVVAYRTDLAGLMAVASGAIASAIGSYPSVRRLNPVGQHGYAIDPEDMSPHLLIADMLRFARSTHMRRVWFANAYPFNCGCLVCEGASIDRLHGSSLERLAGHQHNVAELGRAFASTVGMTPEQLRAQWKGLVAGAIDVYPQLSSHIGAPLPMPVDLQVWSR